MSADIAGMLVLPAALLLDRIFSEPPERVHPVVWMGRQAELAERLCRALFACPARLPAQAPAKGGAARRELAAGWLAGLAVAGLWTLGAWLLGSLAEGLGQCAGGAAAAVCAWLCMAPESLARHALRVQTPLSKGRLAGARAALSAIVGRETACLDAAGIARACIESVAENLADGVLATVFWSMAGWICFGAPGACALPALHRAANTLDAMWGKRNGRYLHFGRLAARLDDALGFLPARLSLPAIASAAVLLPEASAGRALAEGWTFRRAHESPNSAWSEAPFAGALGLRLGGPALYQGVPVCHPWLGWGTPLAGWRNIASAVRLMRTATVLAAAASALAMGLLASAGMH